MNITSLSLTGSVAIRGERGSYNPPFDVDARVRECSYPG